MVNLRQILPLSFGLLLSLGIALSCSHPNDTSKTDTTKHDTTKHDTGSHDTTHVSDTTSHNFSWTEYSIPGENNMTGCWVFGPNNIYVVNDQIHVFDGTTWTRSNIVRESGSFIDGLSGMHIFGFTPTDFWLYDGGLVFHVKGNVAYETRLDQTGVWNYPSDGAIHGAWGTSSQDMYFVGDSGTILHYSPSGWSKFPKVTAKSLGSVWGTSDQNIWASGYNAFTGQSEVLAYNGSSWNVTNISTDGRAYAYGLGSVYAYDSLIALSGSVVFRTADRTSWSFDSLSGLNNLNDGTHDGISLCGNNDKDILAAGSWGLVLHWNGKNWYRYNSFFDGGAAGFFGPNAQSISDNTACVAGVKYGQSWVLIGRR